MAQEPVIWSLAGRWRRYALSLGLVFGLLASIVWLFVQFHVTDSTVLTPATKAFFAGIEILMVLIVLMNVASTVAAENTIIVQSKLIRDELAEFRRELFAEDDEEDAGQ